MEKCFFTGPLYKLIKTTQTQIEPLEITKITAKKLFIKRSKYTRKHPSKRMSPVFS